jgi:hypothetical protein
MIRWVRHAQHVYYLPVQGSIYYYSVFHRFGQEKFAYVDLILSSSQFLLPHQLPQNLTFDTKLVKNNHLATLLVSLAILGLNL